MEIHKLLVMTTGHVDRPTAKALDAGEFGAFVREYGWIVACSDDADLPADLLACCAKGFEQGAAFVMFDCDGDVLDGLPLFDW